MIVAAARAMHMLVVMGMIVCVTVVVMVVPVSLTMIMGFVVMTVMVMGMVVMGMVIVPMVVVPMVVVAVIMPAGAVIMGCPLGPEGARDRVRNAALAPHQFGRGGGRRDVEHVRGDLGGHVVAAELPGEAHQPGRVLGPHRVQVLRGGPHRDEPAIVEAQRIAVVQGRGLGERHRETEPTLGHQSLGKRGPAFVVEAHRVGDAVGAHRGAADDRGGGRQGRRHAIGPSDMVPRSPAGGRLRGRGIGRDGNRAQLSSSARGTLAVGSLLGYR